MGFILTSVLRRAAPPSPGVRGARRCPSGSLSLLPGPHRVCLRACVPRRKAGGSAQAAEQGRPRDVGSSGPPPASQALYKRSLGAHTPKPLRRGEAPLCHSPSERQAALQRPASRAAAVSARSSSPGAGEAGVARSTAEAVRGRAPRRVVDPQAPGEPFHPRPVRGAARSGRRAGRASGSGADGVRAPPRPPRPCHRVSVPGTQADGFGRSAVLFLLLRAGR